MLPKSRYIRTRARILPPSAIWLLRLLC